MSFRPNVPATTDENAHVVDETAVDPLYAAFADEFMPGPMGMTM